MREGVFECGGGVVESGFVVESGKAMGECLYWMIGKCICHGMRVSCGGECIRSRLWESGDG